MKALSIAQPWAELIISGRKSVELRGWDTPYRGEFAIHVSKTVNGQLLRACEHFGYLSSDLERGVLIGVADIAGVIRYRTNDELRTDIDRHCYDPMIHGKLRMPQYGLILQNIERLERAIPRSGQLGLFEVPDLRARRSKVYAGSQLKLF